MTTITIDLAGQLSDGQDVHRYVINNGLLEVSLLDLGVRATSITLAGVPHNLILAYPALAGYEQDKTSMGAVVGRYANRIRDGRFVLNGETVQLSRNRGSYHLHGGFNGFASRRWYGAAIDHGVCFSLESPDGDEGYPGHLNVSLEVRVLGDMLEYRYEATADADTIINLTNHTYFNLDNSPDILNHRLQLFADLYLPIDNESLPTGGVSSVAGSPFDFRQSRVLGLDIGANHEQIHHGAGYDHCFALRDTSHDTSYDTKHSASPSLAARLSGNAVEMTVYTTEPAVQLYSGNHLPQQRQGVCLETQHYPDSPNHAAFPSTLLRAGATYSSVTRYRFQTQF